MKLTKFLLSIAVCTASASAFCADVVSPFNAMQTRVIESGRVGDTAMIVFVSDTSKTGKAFEKKFFGRGGQAVYKTFDGMFVQIADKSEMPDFLQVGDVVALTSDGSKLLTEIASPKDMQALRQFAHQALRLAQHDANVNQVVYVP